MSIQNTTVRNNHQCQNIHKITVSGAELNELRNLVKEVMLGGPARNDGLQEIVNELKNKYSSAAPMVRNTLAAYQWLNNPKHRKLYQKLHKFGIQPKVEKCRTDQQVCQATKANRAASPDLYADLAKLAKELAKSSTNSLTYYIYDRPQHHCAFFGMHKGMLSFALSGKTCQ